MQGAAWNLRGGALLGPEPPMAPKDLVIEPLLGGLKVSKEPAAVSFGRLVWVWYPYDILNGPPATHQCPCVVCSREQEGVEGDHCGLWDPWDLDLPT